MLKIQKLFTITLLLCSHAHNIYAAPSKKEILELSLRQNDNIAAQIAVLKEKRYSSKYTIADNLLEVNFDYDIYKVKNHDLDDNSLKNDYRINEMEFSATQKIFNPNLYPLRKISISEEKKAKTEIDKIISETLLATINALIDLEILNHEEQLLKKNLSYATELYKITKIKKEAGQAAELDFLNSQQNLLKNETKLLQNSQAKATKIAELEKLTNLYNFTNYDFAEDIKKIDVSSLKNLLVKLQQNNSELQIKQYDVAIAKDTKLLKKSDFLPTTSLYYTHNTSEGGYSYINQNYDEVTQETYGINISVPLFASGKKYFDTKKASSVIVQKSKAYEQLKKTLKENLITIWEQVNVNEALIKQNAQAKKLAETSLQIAKSEYLVGKIDFTDLLAAQNNLLESEYQLIDSELNQQKDKFRILHIIGDLQPEFFDFSFHIK